MFDVHKLTNLPCLSYCILPFGTRTGSITCTVLCHTVVLGLGAPSTSPESLQPKRSSSHVTIISGETCYHDSLNYLHSTDNIYILRTVLQSGSYLGEYVSYCSREV